MLKKHRVLVTVAIFLLTVLVLLATPLIFLSTPTGERFVLGKIKSTFEADPNCRFEFSEANFGLFSGFHFKNLKLIRMSPGLKVVIRIDEINVHYAISFLKRAIIVDRVDVLKPDLEIETEVTESVKPAPSAKKEANQESLDAKFDHPFFQITVESVRIQDLKLHYQARGIDLEKRPTETKLSLDGLDLSAGFSLSPGRVETHGTLKMAKPMTLAQSSAGSALLGMFGSGGTWKAIIQREGRSWTYRVSETRFELAARDVLAKSVSTENTVSETRIAGIRSNFSADLMARSESIFRFSDRPMENAIENLAINFVSTIERLSLESKKASQRTVTRIGEQKTQVLLKSANAESELSFELEHKLRGIEDKALLKSTSGEASVRGSFVRSLAKGDFVLAFQLGGIDLLKGKAGFERSGVAWKARADLDLILKTELAALIKSAATLKQTGLVRVPLSISAEQTSSLEPLHVSLKTQSKLDRTPGLKGSSELSFAADVSWKETEARLDLAAEVGVKQLEMGDWRLKISSQLSLAKKGEPERLATEGQTELSQVRATEAVPIRLTEPLALSHRFVKEGHKVEGEVRLLAQDLLAPEKARVRDTDLKLKLNSPDLSAARDVDFEMTLKQGAITLDPRFAPGAPALSGLKVSGLAKLRNGERFTLEKFHADLDDSTFVLDAEAEGSRAAKDLHSRLNIALKVPTRFPDLGGHHLRGEAEIPIKLVILGGREISLQGEIGLKGLEWQNAGLGVSGINGKIPFNERLKYDGKNFRFAEVLDQNPFERVDFERVRPLLSGAEVIQVKEIRWEEKRYGPFTGFFALRQNRVFVHQFDFNLGGSRNGRLNGEMFFDLRPSEMQMGLLTRMTGINLSDTLPSKFVAKMPAGDKMLSGRAGFVVDLAHSSADGRIDITEIGGPQLIALTNLVDPTYEDEKLNKVRSLLQYGYPTFVSIDLKEGYMNLDLGLSLLGVKKREFVREIPISSLLAKSTSGVLSAAQKGPLK